MNYYYITLFLGNTKQNQTYLLDTTSSILTSPCSLCLSCGDHANDYFQIESNVSIINSSTYECTSLPNVFVNENTDYCIFFSDFENEQISGLYTYSSINFEPITSKIDNEEEIDEYISKEKEFTLPIGCSTKETGVFQSRISDGIIGLNNNRNSIVGKLLNMGLIKNNLFSICLNDDGGYLSLGEIDNKYHVDENISYVNYNQDSELYELNINKIFIGSYQIELDSKIKSIIDTSSTISYFPKNIFNYIMTGFFYDCSEKNIKCENFRRVDGYGLCVTFDDLDDMDYAINILWPNIIIKFNDYEFIWEPKNYFFNFSSSLKYKACIGLEANEKNNTIILGTNFMHGYDIIFDRENYKIGFTQAECGRKMSKKLYLINRKKKAKEIIIKKKEIIKENEIKENKVEENTNDNNNNNEDNINVNEIKNNYNGDSYIKYYYILGIIFIIIIIIIIILTIKYNSYDGKEKYNEILMNDRNEIKYENEKSSSRVIEMVENIK